LPLAGWHRLEEGEGEKKKKKKRIKKFEKE